MKPNPVVHFEMAAENTERVGTFYKNVFGWDMQPMGQDYGGYLMAMTTASNDKGPLKPGAINGGFYIKQPGENPAPSIVISVDNLEESVKAVTEAGGEIIGLTMDIPGVGLFRSIKDTEGNIVGLMQPHKL